MKNAYNVFATLYNGEKTVCSIVRVRVKLTLPRNVTTATSKPQV